MCPNHRAELTEAHPSDRPGTLSQVRDDSAVRERDEKKEKYFDRRRFFVREASICLLKCERFTMKTLSVIIALCLAASGAAASQTSAPGQKHVLTKISKDTGVPARTLSRQRAKTGLGFGALEKANLLARASGHTFRKIVSRFKSGEGWGKIAHDAGLKLGKLVSRANHSAKAAHREHNAHMARAEARRDRHERAEARRDRHERAEAREDRHERAEARRDRHERITAKRDRDERNHPRAQSTHGKSIVQSRSMGAHGNSSLSRPSAISRGLGHAGAMNSLGHALGPVHGGAMHGGMGHGHGGGGR